MGRNRRKAGVGAVERAVYDIFGNIIGQEDDVAPTPTETITTISDPDFEHVDTTVFNPVAYSATLQTMLKEQYADMNQVISIGMEYLKSISGNSQDDWIINNMPQVQTVKGMIALGLDPQVPSDRRLYTDLISGTSNFYSGKWNPSPEERKEMRKQDASVPDTGDVEFEVGFSRRIKVDNPTKVVISNVSFSASKTAPPGIGYMMIARQISAARQLAKKLGKPVEIETTAHNSEQSQKTKKGNTGFHVWPKLGYVFEIPETVKVELRRMGFTDKQMNNSATLMQSRNPQGQLGFDVWSKALVAEGDSKWAVNGRTVINPNASTPSPAEQVTIAYGKRKGYLKMQQNKRQNNDVFLSSEDDAILRDVWASMGRLE